MTPIRLFQTILISSLTLLPPLLHNAQLQMKHFLLFFSFFLTIFILPSSIQALDNSFICVCNQITADFSSCAEWGVFQNNCDLGYSPNLADCNTAANRIPACTIDPYSNSCRPETACILDTNLIIYNWGDACDPGLISSGEAECESNTSCQLDYSESPRCLKSNLGPGDNCRDHIECVGGGDITSCDDGFCRGDEPPPDPPPPIFSHDFKICQQAGSIGSTYFSKCCNCLTGNPDCSDNLNQRGIWTAIGCINFRTSNQITIGIIRLGVGMSGGLALLLILFGSFLITTSAGNPEKLKTGQQTITSAIIGLIFILFSITIFKFIGVEIISIPGL